MAHGGAGLGRPGSPRLVGRSDEPSHGEATCTPAARDDDAMDPHDYDELMRVYGGGPVTTATLDAVQRIARELDAGAALMWDAPRPAHRGAPRGRATIRACRSRTCPWIAKGAAAEDRRVRGAVGQARQA